MLLEGEEHVSVARAPVVLIALELVVAGVATVSLVSSEKDGAAQVD